MSAFIYPDLIVKEKLVTEPVRDTATGEPITIGVLHIPRPFQTLHGAIIYGD